jgi:hypothetical protein
VIVDSVLDAGGAVVFAGGAVVFAGGAVTVTDAVAEPPFIDAVTVAV